jgi:hypothetical protein
MLNIDWWNKYLILEQIEKYGISNKHEQTRVLKFRTV